MLQDNISNMPPTDPVKLYQEVAALSAGKLKSVLLLMDRAVLLLKEAQADTALRPTHTVKVQNILAELERSLNVKEGDQAKALFVLFDYVFAALNQRNERAIETALKFLTPLRDTLKKI